MPLSDLERAKLEDYQFMMGSSAGGVALVLDNLTDVMALLAKHTLYCRVEKGARAGQPPLDVEEALQLLHRTKDLVRDTLVQMRSDPTTSLGQGSVILPADESSIPPADGPVDRVS